MSFDSSMLFWFVTMIVFIGVELMAPALVSIWFALAALVVTLLSNIITSPLHQFYIFVVLSGVFLILTRPVVKKLLEKRKPLKNRIYNQEIKILKKIDEDLYEVKLDGKYWRATCDEKLEVGDLGIVEKVEGNKLIIKKRKK